MSDYVIGIDAGGTKSRACAFDLQGNLLCCQVTGQGNFLSDFNHAWDHVISAADACITYMGKSPKYLALGAAGLYGSGLEYSLEENLKNRYGCSAKAVDDGTMALYGTLKGKDGILVIAGTGSVVYGKSGGTILRIGGWGQILDDRGSGYEIALNGLKELVRGYDAGRKMSLMEKELLNQTGCSSIHGLPAYLKNASKRDVGALARTVLLHSEKGDEEAGRILSNAGQNLAEMAMNAAKRLELEKPTVAVSGSILKKCQPVLEAFWNMWREKGLDFEQKEEEELVERAALWFYQKETDC